MICSLIPSSPHLVFSIVFSSELISVPCSKSSIGILGRVQSV